MNLIIGSNGYLAAHLLKKLDLDQTITVSTSAKKSGAHLHFFLKQKKGELVWPKALDAQMPRIKTIYILGRPPSIDFHVNQQYYSCLKNLIYKCSNELTLESIYFASTTMVYDGEVTKPWTSYEYFKLDFELFLSYIFTAVRPDINIQSLRLPILVDDGSESLLAENQFVNDIIAQYQSGSQWPYAEEDEPEWGTSWLFTPDLADYLANNELVRGCRVLDTASGFFRYVDLHRSLKSRIDVALQSALPLMQSSHLIEDQLNMPLRRIDNCLEALF